MLKVVEIPVLNELLFFLLTSNEKNTKPNTYVQGFGESLSFSNISWHFKLSYVKRTSTNDEMSKIVTKMLIVWKTFGWRSSGISFWIHSASVKLLMK
jgi:hypothetical protein